MKTPDYKVKRDDVCVGVLWPYTPEYAMEYYEEGIYDMSMVTEEDLYQFFDNRPWMIEKIPHFTTVTNPDEEICRTMIFTLDENNMANDLLYDCPHYPIPNISDDRNCMSKNIIIIQFARKIGKVLEYFGYPEELTIKEIIDIKKTFFGDWVLDNCEIFGVTEDHPAGTGYECFDSKGVHRSFSMPINFNSPLPLCYFMAFWLTRFTDFTPLKEECNNKSLESLIRDPKKKIKEPQTQKNNSFPI